MRRATAPLFPRSFAPIHASSWAAVIARSGSLWGNLGKPSRAFRRPGVNPANRRRETSGQLAPHRGRSSVAPRNFLQGQTARSLSPEILTERIAACQGRRAGGWAWWGVRKWEPTSPGGLREFVRSPQALRRLEVIEVPPALAARRLRKTAPALPRFAPLQLRIIPRGRSGINARRSGQSTAASSIELFPRPSLKDADRLSRGGTNAEGHC